MDVLDVDITPLSSALVSEVLKAGIKQAPGLHYERPQYR